MKIVRAGPSSLRRCLSIPRRKHHESCDSVKHSKHFQTCRLHWRHYYRDHQHRGDAERDAHDGCNLFVHRRELHSVERLTKSRFFNDVLQTSSVRDFFLYCQSEAAHATRTAFVSFIFHSEAWAACEAAYSCMRCARTDDPAHSRASAAQAAREASAQRVRKRMPYREVQRRAGACFYKTSLEFFSPQFLREIYEEHFLRCAMRVIPVIIFCATLCAVRAQIKLPENIAFPFSLKDAVVGKMPGEWRPYLIFAIDPRIDQYVSAAMLQGDGGWDGELNGLYKALLAADLPDADEVTLDLGANIGAFSLYAASSGRRVMSFEMQPFVYGLLQLSRMSNGFHKNMKVFNTALWNETGKTVSFAPNIGNFGGTSLLAAADESRKITILTTQVSQYITESTKIFFLKIDVENVEEYVLMGMREALILGRVRHLVMETRNKLHYSSAQGWS